MNIKFLVNTEIDRRKWNICVENSPQYIPYSRYEYLEGVCNGVWGGLIKGDYEAVFPIPYRKKWGLVYYIYQPNFCQQLGVFGDPSIKTEFFLKKLPIWFRRVHLCVHGTSGEIKGAEEKPNFILYRNNGEKPFNKDATKNINKCKNANISYTQTKDIGLVLKTYHSAWGDAAGFSFPQDYIGFEKACRSLLGSNHIYICIAKDKKLILGAAIFLVSKNTVHYVCAAPTEEGKRLGIMHGVIDHIADQFPNKSIDFEGSSIPSVASFYQKFGAQNVPYLRIERNLRLF